MSHGYRAACEHSRISPIEARLFAVWNGDAPPTAQIVGRDARTRAVTVRSRE
jgi:hypothetical protein